MSFVSYRIRICCAGIDSPQGNILTVTGYPPNRVDDAPADFLRIVRIRTGDRGAYIVR
jgi:hypothetical protein